MGSALRLEDANVIAFLTSPGLAAPRLTGAWLKGCIAALAENPLDSFVGLDDPAIERLRQASLSVQERMDRANVAGHAIVEPDQAAELVEPLRRELARFTCFAFVVDDGRDQAAAERLRADIRRLAEASEGRCLCLMPAPALRERLRIADPFPPLAAAADSPGSWPGVAIWSQDASAFHPHHDVADLIAPVAEAIRAGNLGALARAIAGRRPTERCVRLLHLSDLHFGNRHALGNQPFLEAELSDVARTVDRVVITGDLFDSPHPRMAAEFRAFMHHLEELCCEPPIWVPGNHDQKHLGNFGTALGELAKIPWSPYVADPASGCLFIGFNSSEQGQLARGRLSGDQLKRVGAQIRSRFAAHPEEASLLRVVLVHHHPFSFTTPERTLVQRLLSRLGISEEAFLRMENAQRFIRWCAAWRIPLILHGHKHVPRHCRSNVDGNVVTAVGCGTSLGAEHYPLSYNMIVWSPRAHRWSVSFYSSSDGKPFSQDLVSISVVDGRDPAQADA